MNTKANKVRYAFVKNGDVVKQLMRITQHHVGEITSGPDAFLADFLRNVPYSSVLMVGHGSINSYLEEEDIIAKVFEEKQDLIQKVFGRMFAFFGLIVYLLKFRPERIICGRTGGMFWACFLISKLISVPLIHSRHNQINYSTQSWFKQLALDLDNWCIRRVRNVICHGPFLNQQLRDIGVNRKNIFEFDIGFEDFLANSNGDSNFKIPKELENHRIILFIGRVQANKGILDLFDACVPILANDSDLKLVYVGTGSGEETLRKRISTHGFQSKVQLLGEVSHNDLAQILSLSYVVVAATRPEFPEGRCMVVMESLVMGVPVIAPNFGPFPYLITHNENGLLYKPGSVNDLREKLKLMLTEQGLYETLRSGACISGARLVKPALTFGQAVMCAFESKANI